MSRFLLLNFEDFSPNHDITKSIQPFNPFCICCLERDGPMFDLDKCDHSGFLGTFCKPELKEFNQLVCLQCHNLLKKINSFQAQIVESYRILLSGQFMNNTINTKKINNLSIQSVVDSLHLPPETENIIEDIESNQDFIKENDPNIQYNEIPIMQDTNMEHFEESRLNKNIKTALEILERNNQSFVSLSSQLQFLNGEHLSFLEPSLLSKEILTDIPLVNAKSCNDLDKLEIEIDGSDKIFYDSLDLSPELMEKEVVPDNTDIEEVSTNFQVQTEVEPKKACVTKQKKERKIQKPNSLTQMIKRIKLSHIDLNRERILQAQSEAYLKYKFRCETCIIGFNYKENLEDHVKRKHGEKEGGVICEICSQVVPTVGSVTEHNYRHYTRYECVRCNKRFHTHDEATQHCAKHQTTAKKYFTKPTVHLKKVKLKMKPSKA